MKNKIYLILVTVVAILSGCATPPQQSVNLAPDAFSSKSDRVGVAMTPLPKVDTHLPGAGCLLCYAAASLANKSLSDHVQTLPYEDIPKLKNAMAELFRKKGLDVQVIADELNVNGLPDFSATGQNIAKKDFTSLQKKYNIDKIVVIDIATLGMQRTYANYFPTSDPKAILQGTGYMVNLKNNAYEWYHPVNVIKGGDNNWDEPPKFPGLTNAYFQVLEIGKDSFLKPLGQ